MNISSLGKSKIGNLVIFVVIAVSGLYLMANMTGFMSAWNSKSLLNGNINQPEKPWNFVFILADDMGWNQTGYGGSDFFETPNIDRIAREGMYFTQAYAPAPICSPSRASILTGKYPARLHITEYIPGDPYPWAKLKSPEMAERLALDEITIAEMLKRKGYKSGMFGKWHVNKDKNYEVGRPGDPRSQGFDEVYTTVKPPYSADPMDDPHHTIELTDLSVDFIEKYQNSPFFLYLSFHAVHRPLMEDPALIYKYISKPGSDRPYNNPIMGAMIERMDTQIGRILDKLEELGLSERTAVIFYSDNGGLISLQTQDPLRGGKSYLYEGGNRVPLAIRWPGVVKPGTKSSVPVTGADFFPTFAEMVGVKDLPEHIDGMSLVPLLTQSGNISELQNRAIYWHYPHYHRFSYAPGGAILQGDYKLIEWYERSYYDEENPVSLYNLKKDPGENNDLSDEMPQKTQELWDKLKKWRNEVGAQKMKKNPNFDPSKALFWNPEVNPHSAEALGLYY